MNYYGYRFYNSKIVRWMNRDPLGEKGGFNLYGFVGGNSATCMRGCLSTHCGGK
ncbi:MAG: hypothetical protein COA36_13185 [Desulfotalea sp.]|nr:MAG: hypothetical protein COA36_13185 [Desulfotalea sp.]